MPYRIYEVQMVWQGPGDNQFVNTFHLATANAQPIDDTDPGIAEGVIVNNAINGFYNDWAAAGMSPAANNAGSVIKIYDITGPGPAGPPKFSYMWSGQPIITSSSDPPLPWEVCCCLSYEAFLSPGTVRARRRGRVYLGPLTMEALEWDNAYTVIIKPGFRAAVLNAFMTCVDDLLDGGYEIGPYSRADLEFHALASIWVDDAPDIQRRRGQKPTVKTRQDRLSDNTGWV